MKKMFVLAAAAVIIVAGLAYGCGGEEQAMEGNLNQCDLTPKEERVIVDKGTEAPFSGEYYDHFEEGVYVCKRCDTPLFRSTDKFDGGCGWPSFDDEIEGAVREVPDSDGSRTEILCENCGAHLGHMFTGEGFTTKDTRHCVNSISLEFIPAEAAGNYEKVVLGGGCFWCVEAVFDGVEGVVEATSGYAGGTTVNPSYEEVCSENTGHAEVVSVEYDPREVSLEELLDIFFTAHDPTSKDWQGNDVGTQYRSVILYKSEDQKAVVETYIDEAGGDYEQSIVTEVAKLDSFFPADDYHQNYYENNPDKPYCQAVIAPKVEKAKQVSD